MATPTDIVSLAQAARTEQDITQILSKSFPSADLPEVPERSLVGSWWYQDTDQAIRDARLNELQVKSRTMIEITNKVIEDRKRQENMQTQFMETAIAERKRREGWEETQRQAEIVERKRQDAVELYKRQYEMARRQQDIDEKKRQEELEEKKRSEDIAERKRQEGWEEKKRQAEIDEKKRQDGLEFWKRQEDIAERKRQEDLKEKKRLDDIAERKRQEERADQLRRETQTREDYLREEKRKEEIRRERFQMALAGLQIGEPMNDLPYGRPLRDEQVRQPTSDYLKSFQNNRAVLAIVINGEAAEIIVDKLMAAQGMITTKQRDAIKAQVTTKDKVQYLLDLINNLGVGAIDILAKALESPAINRPDIAKRLRDPVL